MALHELHRLIYAVFPSYQSLAHISNICPTSLTQGRFTWRHNSVLQYFVSELTKLCPTGINIYADLPGYTLNGMVIPADVLVTSGEGSKPDLVIINRNEKIMNTRDWKLYGLHGV